MGAKVQRVAALICLPLIVAALACSAVAFWLVSRQHELSGVPWGRIAHNIEGRKFYTQRGGGPLDQRPQAPMTEEQYRVWEIYNARSRNWGLAGVLFWMAAVTALAVLGESRRRKKQSPNQVPRQTGAATAVIPSRRSSRGPGR